MPPNTQSDLSPTDGGPTTPMPATTGREALPTGAPGHRWYHPSLTDFFFFALMFVLFLSDPAGWDRLVWDGDTGLHTRTGDYILDHGNVPVSDPFSFTKPNERWFALQWLTGVLFAILNRWAGLKGIVLLCGVVIAMTSVVLLRHLLYRGANGLAAILMVLLAGNAMSIHFHARPHIFTLLFLALSHFLLSRDLSGRTPWLWAIVPLTLLWANMHSAFPVVLAVICLVAAGSAITAFTRRGELRQSGNSPWVPVIRYSALLAACTGVTLINPNGFELHRHILQFLNNPWTLAYVHEYQPPTFTSEPMYYFLAVLVASTVLLIPLARRGEWPEILLLCAFGYGALTSVRHVPLFILIAMPSLAAEAARLWNRFRITQKRDSVAAVIGDVADRTTARLAPVSVWSAAVVVGVALLSDSYPSDLSAKYFPRQIVRRHTDELGSRRVFTTDQWGDYLLWANYPRQRVFIDGRSDFFQQGVGDEYLLVHDARPGWQHVMDKYRVDLALVPIDVPLARTLKAQKGDGVGWDLVDEDKKALLYRRRVPVSARNRIKD